MGKQFNNSRYKWLSLMGMLGLISLACSLGVDNAKTIWIKNTLSTLTPTAAAISQVAVPAEVMQPQADPLRQAQPPTATSTRRTHLPTLTPTPLVPPPIQPIDLSVPPAANPTLDLTLNPGATATPTPTPILPSGTNPTATQAAPADPNPTATLPPPPNPTDIPNAEVDGWVFRGVQTSLELDQATVVGELINNTGTSQQAVDISGIFYDDKDQVIQNEIDTLSYVPTEIIPVGAHIPFELVIESAQPIYRLDLMARSAPATASPRQDFQFTNITQWTDEANTYCLDGEVKNAGSPLVDYLVVMAIAYNEQGNVVSFGEYSPVLPNAVLGDQASPFEMCIDPLNQNIARHELRALGY